MKKFFLLIVFVFSILTVFAQNLGSSLNQQNGNQTNNNGNHIGSSGNVGIGTNNPTHKFEVVGNSKFEGKVEIDSTVILMEKMEMDGRMLIKDSLIVDGPAKMNSTLEVEKETFLKDSLVVNGGIKFKNLINEIDDDNYSSMIVNQHTGLLENYNCKDANGFGLGYWVFGYNKIFAKNQCKEYPNVGIGTEEPETKLDVIGDQYISGRLGIGEVIGAADTKFLVKTTSQDHKIRFYYYNENENTEQNLFIVPKLDNNGLFNPLASGTDLGIFWSDQHSNFNSSSGFVLAPYCDSNKGVKIASNGNVGICTSNIPDNSRLVISAPETSGSYFIKLLDGTQSQILFRKDGKILAKEVEVKSSLPDYVFENDYPLVSLKELENYILQNKHLPGIPSAIEANENGVNLGDMNHLLLKKIEELTLYIIQQQKEIDALKKSQLNKQ